MADTTKTQSPYVRARQEWDERFGDQIKSKNNWRLAAFVSMATTLLCVAGMVAIGYRSNTVPYVVALDDVGRAVPVVPAKQVAVKMRSAFASAAVVPVVDQEVRRAREAAMENSAIPYLGQQRVDRGIDSSGTSGSSAQSKPLSEPPRHVSRGAEAGARTLEPLAGSSTWTQPDSLSESGVRHLRVELQERSSGRWRIVRFDATVEQDAI